MRQPRAVKGPGGAAASPSRDHILVLMRVQLEAIRAHEPGTRRGADAEELHRMRTAVRRFRAILGAVRDMFDPAWLDGLRRELEWLGTVLGDPRDLDVLREHFRAELASLESAGSATAQGLLHGLDDQRARARHRMFQALDGPRYAKLLRRLEGAIRRPRVVASDLSLQAVAAGQFKKLRKAVKALPEPPSSRGLHAVRIKVERARCAAELAQAVRSGDRPSGSSRGPRSSRTSWASIRMPSWPRRASAPSSPAPTAVTADRWRTGCWSGSAPAVRRRRPTFPRSGRSSSARAARPGTRRDRATGAGPHARRAWPNPGGRKLP